MRAFGGMGSIVLALVLFMGSAALFTVNEKEKALMFRLGEIVKSDFDPGLHFQTPFVNNVRKFDARIQTLDAEPERYLTQEKKNVQVDSYAKWRISDTRRYFTAMGGDMRLANLRLAQIIKDGLRAEFGKRTVQDVVSGERSVIMDLISTQANQQAAEFGIEVIEVRIKRVDLAREVSESVFRRMEAERERVAKDIRSQGSEESEKIRADADRQRTVILAEAYRQAELLRGEGDANASALYAKAFNKNQEFYAFYRSLNAYKSAFSSPSDVMLLDTKSDFFKYFEQKK
jgi:membrane protease subunit HflC